ncbi:acyltransferase family-domain-containing protein [Hypoxylon rubiginosum]|uniref:Acyltransferase family-domain-containing protein n=1 Tax=Hypoxylon rubiginosum TaxID=110542 RepID=A0ACB9YUF9_9PEZI|nr:acyltransferase family-domain-containing protein [Hypoxylon rubiginosum]
MSNQLKGILDVGEWEGIKPSWKPAPPGRSAGRRLSRLKILIRPFEVTLAKLVPSTTMGERGSVRPTAYLDGLRGFASLLVYWHHHQLWAHSATHQNEIFEDSFGYDDKYHLAAFHGIRTFFTGGHYAVSTFFVISGYVLSAKPLSLIQEQEYVRLGDNVASALFRRWLRLYLPLIAVTFLYMTSWHAFGLWAVNANPKGSWRDELQSWYFELKNFSFIYNLGGEPWPSYHYHAWSIQMEFKGSIIIYTCLLAFSRLTKNARLWCQLVLMFYFMYIADGWFAAMFMSGMLLCDLDLLSARRELPRALEKLWSPKGFIFYHILAVSIYLGGVPSVNADINRIRHSRGWYYLSYLKPQAVFDYKWFYLFWAATLLVGSTPRIPWLKRFFETRFCQFLGRISFSLYLVHGPILWTLGDRLYTATGWYGEAESVHLSRWVNRFPLPKTGPLGLELSFLAPHIILLPLTIYSAEVITRLIDQPSVRFAQWLYRNLSPRPERCGGE